MFNPLKLSILSLTVWMTGFLLVDCFSQSALTDEEQDGGPPSQNRFNNTNNLSFNQANRFPINGNNNPLGLNRFQSSPFASPFQSNYNNGFSSFNANNNPFQQQQQANSFLMNGFPSSQNAGFATQQQQSGLFPQNGFQSLNPNFNRNGGVLSGQGSQFNSVNLQNQLMPGSQQQQQQQQLGLGFNQNFVQNPFMMQNQLGLAQNNPLALSLLQQNQLAGLQNNPLIGFQQNPFFNFQNQFGQQQQQQQPNLPFALQQQLMQGSLGLQNNDLNGSQFGLSSNPQLGSSNFGFNQNGLGFGGNFQQSNSLSPFNANAGLGTGSSSLGLGANQILLQGGQFQDPNRFPFGGSTSSINNNRLPTNNGGLFGSQLAGSQSNNRFANDPFLSQRQQLKNSRNGNDRALDFNNTNNDNDGFARQPAFNPFQTPLLMGPVNRPLFGNQFPSPLDQQRLQMNQLAQQQMEEAPLPSPFGRQPSFQQPNAPNGSFNNLPPLNDNPQQGNFPPPPPQHQQWFPLPIPETGFSCDGRPPGYYADVKNGCQTFHICIDDGISSSAGLKRSFACPNGTLFDQTSTICQWKDGVDCSKSQMFYPRPPPAAAAAATPQSDTIQQPPSTTASPFNTQIPSPTDNRFQHNGATPPSSMHGLMFSNVGQPSPALGSLDAGRSMHGFSRSSDEQHPGVRPALFRPSEQLN